MEQANCPQSWTSPNLHITIPCRRWKTTRKRLLSLSHHTSPITTTINYQSQWTAAIAIPACSISTIRQSHLHLWAPNHRIRWTTIFRLVQVEALWSRTIWIWTRAIECNNTEDMCQPELFLLCIPLYPPTHCIHNIMAILILLCNPSWHPILMILHLTSSTLTIHCLTRIEHNQFFVPSPLCILTFIIAGLLLSSTSPLRTLLHALYLHTSTYIHILILRPLWSLSTSMYNKKPSIPPL
jgi:hypothetical protein